MTIQPDSDIIDTLTDLGRAILAYVEYGRTLMPERYTLGVDRVVPHAKFVRLVSWNGTQQCCFGFVRISDGAILYSASWQKPFIAKAGPLAPQTVRGSVYDKTTWAACTAWTGVRTIR